MVILATSVLSLFPSFIWKFEPRNLFPWLSKGKTKIDFGVWKKYAMLFMYLHYSALVMGNHLRDGLPTARITRQEEDMSSQNDFSSLQTQLNPRAAHPAAKAMDRPQQALKEV
jgi:hypothetical protein